MARLGGAVAGGVLWVGISAGAAGAHGVISPAEVNAGEEATFAVTIEHGCGAEGGGSPTVEVAVLIPPELVVTAIPERDDGFVGALLDEDGVLVIDWTGGTLHGDAVDGFAFVAVPQGDVGSAVAVPIYQRCEQGDVRWADDDPAAENPAPVVMVTAAAANPVQPVPLAPAGAATPPPAPATEPAAPDPDQATSPAATAAEPPAPADATPPPAAPAATANGAAPALTAGALPGAAVSTGTAVPVWPFVAAVVLGAVGLGVVVRRRRD